MTGYEFEARTPEERMRHTDFLLAEADRIQAESTPVLTKVLKAVGAVSFIVGLTWGASTAAEHITDSEVAADIQDVTETVAWVAGGALLTTVAAWSTAGLGDEDYANRLRHEARKGF